MVVNRKFWKGKRVFLTGHTGFKGAWLSLWLQQLKANLTGYALSPPTSPSIFELANVANGMTSVEGDIRDQKTLCTAMKECQPEIVIHMAAQPLVRQSYLDPIETYSTNVMGTVNLLEAVRHTESVKAVLNITTDKCYENREWIWGYRENEAMGGFDPYSNSKACSELVTNSFRNSFFHPANYKDHGISIATVRAGNVIGGGDWSADRLIPDCVQKWLNNESVYLRYPNAIRPWQHVLEPLTGYLTLAEKLFEEGPSYSEAWNLGPNDSDSKPVQFLVQYLAKLWEGKAVWEVDHTDHPHEAHYLKLDCSKANSLLGWQPKWNLEIALEKIAEWYKVYQEDPSLIRKVTLDQIDSYSSRDDKIIAI
jgi:CDP-glucose 4,6-dehydratase